MTHFTAADGTKIAYTDEGSGTPLLCLAGLTRAGSDFRHLVPHLPPLRLIRMDYRGRGASGWSGAATYTVPQEAKDALALLDHLGIEKAAILGTSRGGIIGMLLAAMAKPRLLGLCLNDVGPEIARPGLLRIFDYVGRNPSAKTIPAFAEALSRTPGFANVPAERWLSEAETLSLPSSTGLKTPYDPALRDAFLAAYEGPETDLWPLFDACDGLPLALIRGANSDLLTQATVAEMRRRRPDLIFAEVPDRAHIPFLDEPESLRALHAFLKALP